MADYRNQPFKFTNAGLNLVSPPESLAEGQYTRDLNLRVTSEMVLEGRQGTESWEPDQKQYYSGTTRTGPLLPYPTRWDIGRLRAIRYIGQLVDEGGAEFPGYLSIHAEGTDASNTFRVFVNGVPVVAATADCTAYAAGYQPLIPRGYSIIRSTAKNGKPIVIVDGRYYMALQNLQLGVGQAKKSAFDYGDDTADIPVYYAYKLGITKPTVTPTSASGSTGLLDSSPTGGSPYSWKYTFYNTFSGFDSPPSEPTTPDLDLTLKQATIVCTNPIDPQVTHIRVWRVGGTLATTYRLVGQTAVTPCAGGTISFTDNVSDEELAFNEALDEEGVEPFTTIDTNGTTLKSAKFPYAFGPFIGKYVFWVGDAVRPGYVYWNKSGNTAIADELLGLNAVTDPGEELMNGFIFGGNPFVWSKLKLYALDYGGPDAVPEFVPREIPLGMGIAGRWAFATGPNAVFFLGRDGIYATACQGEPPISLTNDVLKRIFVGEDVGDLEAVDYNQTNELRLALCAKNLHFFYKGDSGGQYHLVFDTELGRWIEWSKNKYGIAYLDEYHAWSQTILGDYSSHDIYLFDDSYANSSESFTVHARTGSWDSGIPLTHKQFGVLMLDYDPGGTNITITPYYNSELTAGTPLSTNSYYSSGRRTTTWTLGDYYARSIALDLTWLDAPESHPIIYQANVLFREDEEEVSHWEMLPTSFGAPGWFHLKDGWITLRSNGKVRLTVTTDNTYSDITDIPTTSGEKSRIYVEFRPRKGKLFRLSLDGIEASPGADKPTFRLYGEDSKLYGKPWKTAGTYDDMQPFAAVGYPPYLRKEGGT